MACTCPFPPHLTVSKLARTQVVVPSSFFSICRRLWKIPRITISISSSGGGFGVGVFPCRARSSHSSELAFSQGPSCIFVGPLETANKELLEALYRQVLSFSSNSLLASRVRVLLLLLSDDLQLGLFFFFFFSLACTCVSLVK
eukprot:TRINITY_DN28569_c1_g3_i2.p1 TRINITY_DN28569_c1_g3~~TRINITY_DN28569_c1_g3_i2.p1  ORF type:complete len:143 (+),score=17.87 TRINITY_DN28569_c1_g3_i2:225-653(+)